MSINIDGRDYELVEHKEQGKRGLYALTPVKQQPKWIVGKPISMYEGGDYSFAVTFRATEDQAQLIKEAIQATMEYLMGGRDSTMVNLARRFKIVRHSMRENN